MNKRLKKPESEKEELKELKKLVLSEGRKKQAIGFQSKLILLGGTNCSTETSLAKEVSTD